MNNGTAVANAILRILGFIFHRFVFIFYNTTDYLGKNRKKSDFLFCL